MLFINKNVPGKLGETFVLEKKRPAKVRFKFYESGIPVRGENFTFILTDFDFLKGEILLNQCLQFPGMFLLHKNTP